MNNVHLYMTKGFIISISVSFLTLMGIDWLLVFLEHTDRSWVELFDAYAYRSPKTALTLSGLAVVVGTVWMLSSWASDGQWVGLSSLGYSNRGILVATLIPTVLLSLLCIAWIEVGGRQSVNRFEGGVFHRLEDGSLLWRYQLKAPTAKAGQAEAVRPEYIAHWEISPDNGSTTEEIYRSVWGLGQLEAGDGDAKCQSASRVDGEPVQNQNLDCLAWKLYSGESRVWQALTGEIATAKVDTEEFTNSYWQAPSRGGINLDNTTTPAYMSIAQMVEQVQQLQPLTWRYYLMRFELANRILHPIFLIALAMLSIAFVSSLPHNWRESSRRALSIMGVLFIYMLQATVSTTLQVFRVQPELVTVSSIAVTILLAAFLTRRFGG